MLSKLLPASSHHKCLRLIKNPGAWNRSRLGSLLLGFPNLAKPYSILPTCRRIYARLRIGRSRKPPGFIGSLWHRSFEGGPQTWSFPPTIVYFSLKSPIILLNDHAPSSRLLNTGTRTYCTRKLHPRICGHQASGKCATIYYGCRSPGSE